MCLEGCNLELSASSPGNASAIDRRTQKPNKNELVALQRGVLGWRNVHYASPYNKVVIAVRHCFMPSFFIDGHFPEVWRSRFSIHGI
jgi:hypothetical protein